jgi:HEAT repeat protein
VPRPWLRFAGDGLLSAVLLLTAAFARPAHAAGWNARSEQLVWPSSIEALQRRLSDEDVETRRKAAVELARLPSSTQLRLLPGLFSDSDPEVRLAIADAALAVRLPDAGARVSKWLNDPDPRVREAAAEVLGVLRHAGSVPGLGRVLEDPEASVRRAAALALGNSRNPDASLFLLGHLDDGDPEVRHAVIAALQDLGDPRAVVPLIGRIQEQRAALRQQAAQALGTLGDTRAASALIVALADADAGVRAAAATSLGKLRAQDAVWSLGALLETETETDVQAAALEALGRVGSPASVEAILRASGRARPAEGSVEHALAEAGAVAMPTLERCVFQPAPASTGNLCITALGKIGGPAAAQLIERALRQGAAEATGALTALGNAGDPAVLPTILEYVTAKSATERRAAIDAAAQLLDPDRQLGFAVEPIMSALSGARGGRLEQAALIALLGRTGSPRAAASLIPFARSEDVYLRAVALEALGQLGPSEAEGVLLEALDAAHYPTRWTAAIALRQVGSRRSLDGLLFRFDTAPRADRETLAVALAGPLRDDPTEAQVVRTLRLLRNSPGPIKDGLIEALACVPGARGTQALLGLMPAFGKATRAKVAEALAKHPAARAGLRQLSGDADAAVRANAAWSLGAVGEAEDVASLFELLEDRDVAVAANAVASVALLGRRLQRNVAPELCHALHDSRSYVQANALTGLRWTDAACPNLETPAWLLEHHPAEEVRLAAARLLRDRPRWAEGTPDPLARCAAKDVSGRVASACGSLAQATWDAESDARTVAVAVLIVPPGSTSPASRVPFALVRADGFIRSGVSDRRGAVSEVSAPRGPVRLTLPAAFSD